jgi:hypothetical protein
MASLPRPMELEQEEIDPSRPFCNSYRVEAGG